MQKRRNAERLARFILVAGILSLLGALTLVFTRNRVAGAQPYSVFRQEIEAPLAEAGD